MEELVQQLQSRNQQLEKEFNESKVENGQNEQRLLR
jgi:hypothetical protein